MQRSATSVSLTEPFQPLPSGSLIISAPSWPIVLIASSEATSPVGEGKSNGAVHNPVADGTYAKITSTVFLPDFIVVDECEPQKLGDGTTPLGVKTKNCAPSPADHDGLAESALSTSSPASFIVTDFGGVDESRYAPP